MTATITADCRQCGREFSRHRNNGSDYRHVCEVCRPRRQNRKSPLAERAIRLVRKAVKQGELAPLSHMTNLDHNIACVDCDNRAQCYDHRDYRKPLDVDPVCASCNKIRGPALPYAVSA